jgi:hypothetical protein
MNIHSSAHLAATLSIETSTNTVTCFRRERKVAGVQGNREGDQPRTATHEKRSQHQADLNPLATLYRCFTGTRSR